MKHFSCFHYNVLYLWNLSMIFKNKRETSWFVFSFFHFFNIMMTNVYIIRECQREVRLVFKKQNIKCLMFPSCKRMNALLNVCDNENNQSTRTYVLFLQGKLKELKKYLWVSCKAKVFIRHKQKVTCLPYHKNIYTHIIVTRLQLMSILRIYGIL